MVEKLKWFKKGIAMCHWHIFLTLWRGKKLFARSERCRNRFRLFRDAEHSAPSKKMHSIFFGTLKAEDGPKPVLCFFV